MICMYIIGTEFFKEKRFIEALNSYQEAATLLDSIISHDTTALHLWITSKLNASQCSINLQEYPAAIYTTSEVLKKDEDNIKALYRRAVARNHIGLVSIYTNNII